jgi:hypothetical protein
MNVSRVAVRNPLSKRCYRHKIWPDDILAHPAIQKSSRSTAISREALYRARGRLDDFPWVAA